MLHVYGYWISKKNAFEFKQINTSQLNVNFAVIKFITMNITLIFQNVQK